MPSAAITTPARNGPASVSTMSSLTDSTRHGTRTSAPASAAQDSSQVSSSARVTICRHGSPERRVRRRPPASESDTLVIDARVGGLPGSAASEGPISPPPQVL